MCSRELQFYSITATVDEYVNRPTDRVGGAHPTRVFSPQVGTVNSGSIFTSIRQRLLPPGNHWRAAAVLAIRTLLICLPWFSTSVTAYGYSLGNLEHHRWSITFENPRQAQAREGCLCLGTDDSLNHVDGRRFAHSIPPDGNPAGSTYSLKAEQETFMNLDGLGADSAFPLRDDLNDVWAGATARLEHFRPGDMLSAELPGNTPNLALFAGVASGVWAGTSKLPAIFLSNIPLLLALGALAVASILWMLHRFNLHRSAQQLRERLEERHTERERIARELHDTLLQGVHGLMLSFQAATEQIPSTHPARCKMEKALDRADQVLEEARDRVKDLRDLNEPALNLIDAFSAVTGGLQLEGNTRFALSSHGTPLPLHPIVGEESYRIGSEAIMNAFRHANAQDVEIRIVYTRHAFQLSVDDNGEGIDPQYLPPNTRPGHWGLCGMQERARKIGGRLSIKRGAYRGTEVQLTVPALAAYRHVPRRISLWLRAMIHSRP